MFKAKKNAEIKSRVPSDLKAELVHRVSPRGVSKYVRDAVAEKLDRDSRGSG